VFEEVNIELGFSGAPIINTDSSVIGVIFSRSRGVSSTAYAVQSSEVRKILEKEPDLIRSTNCIP
jgi:V8-like Glu-specific endopeptidase